MSAPFFFYIYVIVAGLIVWFLMWLEDFDGMRSEWKYRRERKRREFLSFDEFYQRYYASSGIPRHTVEQFLDFHARFWDESPELMRPQDDLFRVYAGLDVAGDWIAKAEAEFGITISEDECKLLDGSFDTLLRHVDSKMQHARPSMLRG